MDLHGMPIRFEHLGLATLNAYLEQGSSGSEMILCDDELCIVINSNTTMASDEYAALARKAEDEFSISGPVPQNLAGIGSFLLGCIAAGFEYAFEFIADCATLIAETAGKIVSGTVGGLFKGLGPIIPLLLVGGGICLFVFIK